MNSGDIKDIENLGIKDNRDKWFGNYAATHYNLKDLNSGYYFGKVKKFNMIWLFALIELEKKQINF